MPKWRFFKRGPKMTLIRESEKGQTNQCPRKEIKRQTMIYKTTTQKNRN
jgi:hypothetical protein